MSTTKVPLTGNHDDCRFRFMGKKTPAERLKEWRGLRSQREAAALLSMHSNFYNDYEHGRRSSPSRELAIRFRDVCGIPVDAW